MSKYIIIISIAVGMLISGCTKTLSLGDADFNVSVQKNTLLLGDTAVFSFTGNPDVITFYSGEVGKRYEYRNRTLADGKPMLTFGTKRENGSQANGLLALVSNDFPGVTVNDATATMNSISTATWTDITSRGVMSTGPYVVANIDLSDFAAVNKPIYFAFKYLAFAGSIQNKWTISAFGISNVLPDGTSYTIANVNSNNVAFTNYGVTSYSPGFVSYKIQNNYDWVIGTGLVITGATTVAAATAPAESWAIIGPINLKKVTPDAGTVVKVASQNTVRFIYKYPAKGTYNATFTGGSVSIDDMHYVSKSVPIMVN